MKLGGMQSQNLGELCLKTAFAFLAVWIVSSAVAVESPRYVDRLVLNNQKRLFDQPIDPNLYLVRPGDRLLVTFIYSSLKPYALTVDPEGRIVDETAGLHDLSNMTLTEVRAILGLTFAQLYKTAQIVISINEVRSVPILVTGAVVSPGLYRGFTNQRVSEIIDSAGGLLPEASSRRIVFSEGLDSFKVDLALAFLAGNGNANPYLYGGSNIAVPFRSNELVQVIGEVNKPQGIELQPGDNLELLLRLAGGTTPLADRAGITITDPSNRIEKPGEPIRPGNVISVPALKLADSQRLAIYGAVNRPGRYELSGSMTVADLIALAGGASEASVPERAAVFRRAGYDEFNRVITSRYPVGNGRKDSRSTLLTVLQAADSVIVPHRMGYVEVSGAVANPGRYSCVDGQNALFYLELAGGFLPEAKTDLVDLYNRVSRLTSSHSVDVIVGDGDKLIVRYVMVRK